LGKPMINMVSYLKRKSDISDIPGFLLEIKLSETGRNKIFGQFDQSSLIEPLSERELEVMQLIGQGDNNRVIAEKLCITVGTVKSHISHIFRKLDVKNRTEAVAKLRKLGMTI
jgi:DNA-binding NarL/FixJ family response regulator